MTAVCILLALSLGLGAGWSIAGYQEEETRPRCWRCGRSFSEQQGLAWHHESAHPYDDSGVYDAKGKVRP